MHSAFYEPAGTGAFAASPATAGPWSAQAQHGGPPSALAARAIELHEPDEGQRLARVAVDILRPVPVGKVTVGARTVRPGRRVALVEAIMEADGQEVLRARGWRLALAATAPTGRSEELPGVKGPEGLPGPKGPPGAERLPGAEGSAEIPPEATLPAFFDGRTAGYLSAVDWRFVSGGNFDARERARVWARPRIPLLPGEHPSPMCRALLIADSGSGVSAVLDPARLWHLQLGSVPCRTGENFPYGFKGTPSARQAGPGPAPSCAGARKSPAGIASWSEGRTGADRAGSQGGRAYSGAAACRALRAGAHRARRCLRSALPAPAGSRYPLQRARGDRACKI